MPGKRKHNKSSWFTQLKKRGLTLPGYRYLGPFNALDNGEPSNISDTAAKRHDVGYKLLQDAGMDPYLHWNNYDEYAQREWGDDIGGRIAERVFATKRRATESGILGDHSSRKRNKRLDDRWQASLNNSPDKQEVPQKNTEAKALMSKASTGSGNEGGLKETPVDTHPVVVRRGPPNFEHCSLPYMYDAYASAANTYARDHWFRLTSPYDPQITTSIQDNNAGSGQANTYSDYVADSALRSADFFAYYASMYKYYTVLACRWRVMVENNGSDPIWVYQMFANDERPPELASNIDMQSWAGVRYKYVSPKAHMVTVSGDDDSGRGFIEDEMDEETTPGATTGPGGNYTSYNSVATRNGHVTCEFTGTYHPGDFSRDIRLDTDVENWTLTSNNPTLPERLLIRVEPLNDSLNSPAGTGASGPLSITDTNNYGDTLEYHIRVHLEYLVEFKELKPGLKYPLNRQPLTVTIVQTATAGT